MNSNTDYLYGMCVVLKVIELHKEDVVSYIQTTPQNQKSSADIYAGVCLHFAFVLRIKEVLWHIH